MPITAERREVPSDDSARSERPTLELVTPAIQKVENLELQKFSKELEVAVTYDNFRVQAKVFSEFLIYINKCDVSEREESIHLVCDFISSFLEKEKLPDAWMMLVNGAIADESISWLASGVFSLFLTKNMEEYPLEVFSMISVLVPQIEGLDKDEFYNIHREVIIKSFFSGKVGINEIDSVLENISEQTGSSFLDERERDIIVSTVERKNESALREKIIWKVISSIGIEAEGDLQEKRKEALATVLANDNLSIKRKEDLIVGLGYPLDGEIEMHLDYIKEQRIGEFLIQKLLPGKLTKKSITDFFNDTEMSSESKNQVLLEALTIHKKQKRWKSIIEISKLAGQVEVSDDVQELFNEANSMSFRKRFLGF